METVWATIQTGGLMGCDSMVSFMVEKSKLGRPVLVTHNENHHVH